MRLVGLTGGIAAGKSLVAKRLKELGIPLIDADEVARLVVSPGSSGLAEIVDAFGTQFVTADGALDRGALGALVFSDDQARRQLEAITHPRIQTYIQDWATEQKARGASLAIVDAALMFETGSASNYDAVIVVHAPDDIRRDRLMERDQLSAQQAQSRIDSQLDQKEKIRRATYVIDNGGSVFETNRQVDAVIRRLQDTIQS